MFLNKFFLKKRGQNTIIALRKDPARLMRKVNLLNRKLKKLKDWFKILKRITLYWIL